MTKRDIMWKVSKKVRYLCRGCRRRYQINEQTLREASNQFFIELAIAVRDTGSIRINGLAKFQKKLHPPTRRKLPNGRWIDVPAKTSIKVVPLRTFRDIANGDLDVATILDLDTFKPPKDVTLNVERKPVCSPDEIDAALSNNNGAKEEGDSCD